jgi:hypothetical protein
MPRASIEWVTFAVVIIATSSSATVR